MIDALVKTVLSELKQITKTETVIGEPIRSGNVTLVPVSRISIGFGVGGGRTGEHNKEGEGTGGGIAIEPMAFIVIRDDKVELMPIRKDYAGWGQLVELIPQAVEKIKGLAKKENRTQAGQGKAKK